MPCNCGGKRTATAPVKHQLTLATGYRFADGTTQKTYLTKQEAEAARDSVGPGTIRPVTA